MYPYTKYPPQVSQSGRYFICNSYSEQVSNELTTTNRQLPADHSQETLGFTCENQRDFGQMNVLANNCVSKISVPKGAHSGNGVAYNPVLGLFAGLWTYAMEYLFGIL